jgi:hypothetical protein
MGFRVTVTTSHDWVKIAELAGADPFLNIFHPGTSELEVEAASQATLDTAFANYVADQTNIDAATAAAKATADKEQAKKDFDARRVLIAFARLLITELNELRALHSLPPRTFAQLRNALRNEIDTG